MPLLIDTFLVFSVMQRLSDGSPKFRERFIKHCTGYLDSVISEAAHRVRDKVMTLEEYTLHRRVNTAVLPCFDLIEYVSNINIPDEVFGDQAFSKIHLAAADMINRINVSIRTFSYRTNSDVA